MAGNIYLFIDGIPGESTSEIFRNWIDIDSFSTGVAMEINQESRVGSGGGTSGAADPEDFTFDTKMSVATTVLLQACAMGAVIPRIKLVQCNVVNNIILGVSDYSMGDSMISSVNVDASGGDIPSTSFSINFGSVVWRYHCYNHYMPSKHVYTAQREWSVLTANPRRADRNAQNACSIAPGNSYTSEVSYDQYADGVRVPFTPGTVVRMPQKVETGNQTPPLPRPHPKVFA